MPYCEKDYQKQFGVKCAYCNRYISGKVLQAGDNHHFHPTCARCTKCGDPFGDGEEMYLQGAAIWHPRCGPGPSGPNGIVNGHGEAHTPQHRESERISSSASEMQVRRCASDTVKRNRDRGSSLILVQVETSSSIEEQSMGSDWSLEMRCLIPVEAAFILSCTPGAFDSRT